MKPFCKLLLIVFTICLISCAPLEQKINSVEEPKSPEPINAQVDVQIPEDVAAAVEDYWGDDSTQVWDEEAMGGVSAIVTGPEEPRQGKLAVYCPHEMIYKQTSDIIGFIADVIDDELIEDVMVGRVAEMLDNEDFELQENDLLIRELQYYNRIELRLDDADNEGFTIKKVHEDDLQVINDKMEGWHWKVTPTNNNQKQQLILKVIVYDQNGEKITSFGKTYHIHIKIESGIFLRNTHTLFVENPEWAFASIITPILTFMIGRYNSRRKKKKGKGKKEQVQD